MNAKKKLSVSDWVVSAVLILCGLICLVPILNTIAISLSDKTSASLGQVSFWPVNFNLSSYQAMMEEKQFGQSFLVSVVRVILGTSVNMALTILMAYPLSKTPSMFHAKKYYMWVVVFVMMFNGGLVPTFLVVKQVGLIDSIWALILPGAISAYNLILMRNFVAAIPPSLEEAAYIDGANELQILWKVIVPLCKPALATFTLFHAVGHWNGYFNATMYINSRDKWPLMLIVREMVAESGTSMVHQSATAIEDLAQPFTLQMAIIIFTIIPILCVYPFVQKYFMKGMLMGSVKG